MTEQAEVPDTAQTEEGYTQVHPDYLTTCVPDIYESFDVDLSPTNVSPAPQQAKPNNSAVTNRTVMVILVVVVVVAVVAVLMVTLVVTGVVPTAGKLSFEPELYNTGMPGVGQSSPTPTSNPVIPSPNCDNQCETSEECGNGTDISNCGRCRNARIRAGPNTFCIQSCRDAGSVSKMPGSPGVTECQEKKFTNIALRKFGTTCEASSHSNEHNSCESVFDGGASEWNSIEETGAWIQFNFNKPHILIGLDIRRISRYGSQCSRYGISYNGHEQHKQILWECDAGQPLRRFFFQPTTSQTVRITCEEDCGFGMFQGLSGIWIWILANENEPVEIATTSTTTTTQPPKICDAQCDPSSDCGEGDDPTSCGRCRNSQIRAEPYTFCVEKCEDVGSTEKSRNASVVECVEKTMANIAVIEFGTSCIASSIYPSGNCENVFDGGSHRWISNEHGVGAWIQFHFNKPYVLVALDIRRYFDVGSQCTSYDISFDGHVVHKRIEWPCDRDHRWRRVFFRPTTSQRLRITCAGQDCGIITQALEGVWIWTLVNSTELAVTSPPKICDPQCDPAEGCTEPSDPTKCGRCKNAEIRAGPDTFCVQSCDAVGSVLKETNTSESNVCQDRNLTNIALTRLGTTCSASSTWDVHSKCENVFDGGAGRWLSQEDSAGAWIHFFFNKPRILLGLDIRSFHPLGSQCSLYDISFNGHDVHEQIPWKCEGSVYRRYFLKPITTQALRITCRTDCAWGYSQAFQGIWIWSIT